MKSPARSLMLVVSALSLLALAGCATAPGQTAGKNDALTQLAVQSAVVVAVDRVVTRSNATPADMEARALRIVKVASALKALGSDALSTLPLIKAALGPELEKLNLTPVERQQADLLVTALVTVGLERTDVAKYAAAVNLILTQVIDAASAYLPAATSARNGQDRFGALFAGDRRRRLPACS